MPNLRHKSAPAIHLDLVVPEKRPMPWNVAMTKPHSEAAVAIALTAGGHQVYFPRTRMLHRIVPLFPNYLFVAIADQWRTIMRTPGIIKILANGDRPATVKDGVVDNLQAMETDGLVRLPENRRQFTIDQQVKITTGPFTGLCGLYKGQSARQRERILLAALGIVDLPAGNIMAA